MFAAPVAKARTCCSEAPGRDRARSVFPRAPFERNVGNQSRLRSLSAARGSVQANLEVGKADDPLEHEADRVADRVVTGADVFAPVATAQRQVARTCDACAEEARTVHAKRDRGAAAAPRAAAAPASVHDALGATGQPLDAPSRAFFEPRLGFDLSSVRVHADDRAAASAQAVGALAYTVGSQIVFGAGRYAPESAAGRRLLAHELVHTVQQSAAEPVVRRQGDDDAGAPQAQPESSSGGSSPGGSSGGSSGGAAGGGPPAGLPDCTAVMGGRGIKYGPRDIAGWVFNHTYLNFKEDATHYWLIEGGPLPSASTTSGAWAKAGSWDSDGNRVTTTFTGADCPRVKTLLFDTQTTYHSKALPYNAWNGPNSNSFCEHLTFKAGVPANFHTGNDKAYDYWRSRTRPS